MRDNGAPRPKLRLIEVNRIERDGVKYFALTDSKRIADQTLLVSERFTPFLGLADGERTVDEIISTVRSGAVVGGDLPSDSEVVDLFEKLDSSLMLDNERAEAAIARRLQEYRTADFRTPALEGKAYPDDPDDLLDFFEAFAPDAEISDVPSDRELKGIITPHIDYDRGGDTYAELWRSAAPDLEGVELAVIFGSDHNGAGPRLTLTNQSYATPWNILPTDTELVGKLARVLKSDPEVEDHPFADELNHIGEHSIELASIWLNWAIGDQGTRVLPILCGSLGSYVQPSGAHVTESPSSHPQIADAIGLLQQVAKHRKTVFIAAADLAHIGPLFGDPEPATEQAKADAAALDRLLLDAAVRGDGEDFLNTVRQAQDRTRVCGLAPIYMSALATGKTDGEWFGYRQCPADSDGGSFVSIAGGLQF